MEHILAVSPTMDDINNVQRMNIKKKKIVIRGKRIIDMNKNKKSVIIKRKHLL